MFSFYFAKHFLVIIVVDGACSGAMNNKVSIDALIVLDLVFEESSESLAVRGRTRQLALAK